MQNQIIKYNYFLSFVGRFQTFQNFISKAKLFANSNLLSTLCQALIFSNWLILFFWKVQKTYHPISINYRNASSYMERLLQFLRHFWLFSSLDLYYWISDQIFWVHLFPQLLQFMTILNSLPSIRLFLEIVLGFANSKVFNSNYHWVKF